MITGHSHNYTNLEVQHFIPLQYNKLTNVVIQGSSWKTAAAIQSTSKFQKEATTASKNVFKAMARKENVEENERGPMNADSSREPSDLYWVLPSYAEPYKKDLKHFIETKKAKLCNNILIKTCFENVEFKIAFANSRNIKQMVVRTKL